MRFFLLSRPLTRNKNPLATGACHTSKSVPLISMEQFRGDDPAVVRIADRVEMVRERQAVPHPVFLEDLRGCRADHRDGGDAGQYSGPASVLDARAMKPSGPRRSRSSPNQHATIASGETPRARRRHRPRGCRECRSPSPPKSRPPLLCASWLPVDPRFREVRAPGRVCESRGDCPTSALPRQFTRAKPEPVQRASLP